VSIRFTRNHDAIRRGVERLLGRKYDYTPRNDYEQQYAYYPTEVVERIRNQVSMSALESLMGRMGGLKEGRKALILISEGYSNILPPQLRNPVATMPGLGNPASRDPSAGDNPLETRAQAFATFDLMDELRQVWDAANRNNVAIYSVDPRGLATNAFDINENVGSQQDRTYLNATIDTLRTLSSETDGRAIVNRNDLTVAMKQIVQDSSAYYLLGYTTTRPSDGKFHEIKVRVRRPGIQVRARRGYWALTPADVQRANQPPKPETPKPVQNALAAIGAPARARVVRTWLGAGPGAGGRTAMTFVWEPVARPGGTSPSRGAETPSQVTLLAAGADGTPYFRGRTRPGAPITFDAPPGDLQLRITAETESADVLDSETRDLRVPDFTVPQTVIATPRVFRVRTVREAEAIKANPQAVPTAAREFSRSERMLVQVTAHAPGVTAPTLRARLLNRAGDAMADVPVASAAVPATIDVPLAALPPGEYVLEIAAAAASGEAQELVGFRIIG
jgi:VWFA-related protein